MKYKGLFFLPLLGLLLAVMPAAAQDPNGEVRVRTEEGPGRVLPPPVAPVSPPTAQPESLRSRRAYPMRVRTEDCRRLLGMDREKPARGVSVPSADYVPGVDVHGRPVASAEDPYRGPGQDYQLPSALVLSLNVDVFEAMGLTPPPGVSGALPIGQLIIGPQGRTTLDGRPLGSDELAALRRACARAFPPRN